MRILIGCAVFAAMAFGALYACSGPPVPVSDPTCGQKARKLERLLNWWWVEEMRPHDGRKGPFTWIEYHNRGAGWDSLEVPVEPPSAYNYSINLGADCAAFDMYMDSVRDWWFGQGPFYEGRGAYEWFSDHEQTHDIVAVKLQAFPAGPDEKLNLNKLLKWWNDEGGTYDWIKAHNRPPPDPDDTPPPPPDPI